MTRPALLLAAHGAQDDSPANRRLLEIAARIAAEDDFAEVAAAFKLGHPGFAAALDMLRSPHVTVVPVMTSDGYYRRVLLPRELRSATSAHQKQVRITPPVGTHHGVITILYDLLVSIRAQFALAPADTAVFVIGHGTERHRLSRQATDTVCHALRSRVSREALLSAFLDEPPFVEEIPTLTPRRTIVILPHLIGGGAHALRDIPERLGLVPPQTTTEPVRLTRVDRTFILAPPLMDRPEFIAIIRDLAHGPAEPMDALRMEVTS